MNPEPPTFHRLEDDEYPMSDEDEVFAEAMAQLSSARTVKRKCCSTEEPLPQKMAKHDAATPGRTHVRKYDREHYQHEPLPDSSHIRLLLLEAVNDSEPGTIRATMKAYPLMPALFFQRPSYAALSYSWGMDDDGDASLCRTIFIEGQALPVTRNLYEGLLRIRARVIYPLWIDAVCINQTDLVERSGQVTQMAAIYHRATETIVWLGEGENDNLNDVFHGVLVELVDSSRSEKDDSQFEQLQPTIEARMQALQAFSSRRYWSRRWVAQEFIIPRRLRWFFGSCSIDATKLHSNDFLDLSLTLREWSSADQNNDLPSLRHNTSEDVDKVMHLLLARYNLHERDDRGEHVRKDRPPGTMLVNALFDFSAMDCSEPLDRIYALLALDRTFTLLPNYSLSPTEQYVSLATTLIRNGLSYRVFNSIRHPRQHRDEIVNGLPSWVPDFREPFRSDVGKAWFNVRYRSSFSMDRRTLICELFAFGKVQSVQHLEHDTTRGSNQVLLTVHRPLEPPEDILFHFRHLEGDAGRLDSVIPGDEMFATDLVLASKDNQAALMFLRPVDSKYKLIRATLPHWIVRIGDVWLRDLEKQNATYIPYELPESRKITVAIV